MLLLLYYCYYYCCYYHDYDCCNYYSQHNSFNSRSRRVILAANTRSTSEKATNAWDCCTPTIPIFPLRYQLSSYMNTHTYIYIVYNRTICAIDQFTLFLLVCDFRLLPPHSREKKKKKVITRYIYIYVNLLDNTNSSYSVSHSITHSLSSTTYTLSHLLLSHIYACLTHHRTLSHSQDLMNKYRVKDEDLSEEDR
jgi:hypothetical protein